MEWRGGKRGRAEASAGGTGVGFSAPLGLRINDLLSRSRSFGYVSFSLFYFFFTKAFRLSVALFFFSCHFIIPRRPFLSILAFIPRTFHFCSKFTTSGSLLPSLYSFSLVFLPSRLCCRLFYIFHPGTTPSRSIHASAKQF